MLTDHEMEEIVDVFKKKPYYPIGELVEATVNKCASKHEQEMKEIRHQIWIANNQAQGANLLTKKYANIIEAKDKEIAELKKQFECIDAQEFVNNISNTHEKIKFELRSQAEEIFSELEELGEVNCDGEFIIRKARFWNIKQEFVSGAEKPDSHVANFATVKHGRNEGSEKPDRKKKVK